MPTSAAASAGLILAPAFDRQPLFVGIQRARQVALKVQRVGQVLQRFALVALVANPTGDLAHPFESRLRLRVLLFLGRLTGAPRQRQDQFQRHEVGLGLEQRLPFLRRRCGDETVRQRIDGRTLAHELPVTVLANVNQAPRRRGVERKRWPPWHSGRHGPVSRRPDAHANAIRCRIRREDRNLRVRVVARVEDVLQLLGRRGPDARAPQREVGVDVFSLLRGKELLDRGAQRGIVGTLTTREGRQGREQHRNRTCHAECHRINIIGLRRSGLSPSSGPAPGHHSTRLECSATAGLL